jgi:hypothetical protein
MAASQARPQPLRLQQQPAPPLPSISTDATMVHVSEDCAVVFLNAMSSEPECITLSV